MLNLSNEKSFDAPYLGQYLEALLPLERKPVGVKFLFTEEEYDNSPLEPLERTIPYCTAVRDAMQGKSRKLSWENFACTASAYALGIEERDSAYFDGRRSFGKGSYANLGVGRRMYKKVEYCGHRIFAVEIAELNEFNDRDPDVVIIVSEAKTAMRTSQAYAYHLGYVENIRLSGMCAVCHELTAYPYETGDINLSLMCSGTRKLAQWKEEELGLGFPYPMTRVIVDGLLKTVNPLERDKAKAAIEERAKKFHLCDSINIVYGKNYDDGSMRTSEDMCPSKASVQCSEDCSC